MPSRPSTMVWVFFALVATSSAVRAGSVEDCDRLMAEVGGPCVAGPSEFAAGRLAVPHREIAGFVLGRDSFQKARKIFGPAKRWHSGDAATSEDKICYMASAGTQPITLVLSSNGAMAGGKIDSLRLIAGQIRKADSCSLTSVQSATATRSGLTAGMQRDELERILGAPIASYADLTFYAYCQERVLRPEDALYASCRSGKRSVALRCGGITARFEAGILKWLDIGYGADETC